MADPFFGEIRIFGFNYAPYDWAYCDGAVIAVQQNAPLYSLIGNTYGGSYGKTFALPDLRGQAVIGTGTNPLSGYNYPLNEKSGEQGVTLDMSQSYPNHDHTVSCSVAPATATNPSGNVPSHFPGSTTSEVYIDYTTTSPKPSLTALDSRTMAPYGAANTAAHENRQPYLAMNFCICTSGVYPAFP